MSLLEPYRKLKSQNIELQKQLQELEKQNQIFLEEIRALKKALYGLTIDISK